MHEVLKSFPYSSDGIRVKTLEAGSVVKIRDDLAHGLLEEGFIRPASANAPPDTGKAAGSSAPYTIRRAHQGKFVVVGPDGKDASIPMTKAAAEAEAARLSAG
jgi:hypothetical protein